MADLAGETRLLVGRGLSFDVDGRRVLDDVSLTGEPGRMLAVTGSSGSGKTTLLSLVGGLAKPAAGEVSYDGGPVTTKQGEPLPGTGFVLQSYGLVPTLTAAENVAIALRGRGVAATESTERAVEALGRVGIDELADRLISELSGGQLQRVAVARALVVAAEVLLADEPTSELDEANRDAVVGQLRMEANRGAVVLARHPRPRRGRGVRRRDPPRRRAGRGAGRRRPRRPSRATSTTRSCAPGAGAVTVGTIASGWTGGRPRTPASACAARTSSTSTRRSRATTSSRFAASTSTSPRASRSRCSARRARASRPCSACSAVSSVPRPAR